MAQPVQIKNYSPESYFDFTRPANTTTYTANDILTSTTVGADVTPLKFPVMKEPNGSGFVTGARIMKGSTGVTGASFRLWLFIREPFSAAGYPADNAALSFSETAFRSCIGFFDFDAANWITGTTSAYCDNSFEKSLPFSLDKVGAAPSSDSYAVAGQVFDRTQIIYGLLQATGAYAPASAETFRVALDISAVPGSSRSMASGDVVQGTVANDAVATGNPVRIGGKANSANPTEVTAGDAVDLWLGLNGQVIIGGELYTAVDGVGNTALGGMANALNGNVVPLVTAEHEFNGTSWDRKRANTDLTLLASAARTATLNSGDLTNYNGRGLHVVVDVTNAGTGSITITIQAKDALSGQYYTLLLGAAVTTVSTNVYKVYPGLTAAANAVASDILTRTYRILITHNNANSITYSVGATVIL